MQIVMHTTYVCEVFLFTTYNEDYLDYAHKKSYPFVHLDIRSSFSLVILISN